MRMCVLKRLTDTDQVYASRTQHQYMEDLVRRAPHVKAPRTEPLRYPPRVQEGAGDVERALEDHPGGPDLAVELPGAEEEGAVEDGEDGGEAHCYEHCGAEGAVFRAPELRAEGDCGADEAC